MDPTYCYTELKMLCHMAENSVPTTASKSVLQIQVRYKLITMGYGKKKISGEKKVFEQKEDYP